VAAENRARKLKYYRKRIENEEGFRESERDRCREAMRRHRAHAPEKKTKATVPPAPPTVFHNILSGLVSQLVDSNDPHAIAQAMAAYNARGQRLAIDETIYPPP
jgi:hypothetical protein